MFSRRLLLGSAFFLGLILPPGSLFAADDSPGNSGGPHLSVRALGLTYHFIDVRDDAPYYPLSLDAAGDWVINPGLVFSLDVPTPVEWLPYVRMDAAMYADCALQPAGYLAAMGFFPEASTRHFTFAGGLGLGLALRRNWEKYAIPNHTSDTFSDWGKVEGAWGLYGELEFRFHPADRSWAWVFNVVPGIPSLLLMSTGLRIPL